MEVIYLYNEQIRNELINKFQNKIKEIETYKDTENKYKQWNNFINGYIDIINSDIEDIRNTKVKRIGSLTLSLLKLSKEAIIHRYVEKDIVSVLLRNKCYFIEKGLNPKLFSEDNFNTTPCLLDDCYPFKNNLFENYVYLWDSNLKTYKQYPITYLYHISESVTNDWCYRLRENIKRCEYEDNNYISLSIVFKDRHNTIHNLKYYEKLSELKNKDIFKEISECSDIKNIEVYISTGLGIKSKFNFKGRCINEGIYYIKSILNI